MLKSFALWRTENGGNEYVYCTMSSACIYKNTNKKNKVEQQGLNMKFLVCITLHVFSEVFYTVYHALSQMVGTNQFETLRMLTLLLHTNWEQRNSLTHLWKQTFNSIST